MNAHAADLWQRAMKALVVARSNLALDSDAAASRAYYAAFYAVSARFALEDKAFARHSAVEAAVHRDLVKPGAWPEEYGQAYSRLVQCRTVADYGAGRHVSPEEAQEAVEKAAVLLRAVAEANPEAFSGLEEV